MKFGYEDLDVWNKATEFAVKVIELVENISTHHKHYRLLEQVEASSASISMNIAEGKGRFSKKEFAQFLYISRGSLYETMTLLEIFRRKKYVPQIVASLPEAIEKGLRLPIVYNCSGYESIEVIRLLEDVVDIYMPDAKFMDQRHSKQFSNAPDYPEVIKKVLKEMHRQVGNLTINSKGIAERGLLIRHLVMPDGVASSEAVLKFIAEEISVHSYVNIMDQYRPEYQAHEYPEINRRITHKEYLEAIQWAKHYQLHRGFR